MSTGDLRASADSPDTAVVPELPEPADLDGEAFTGRLMTMLSRHLPLCLLLDMSSPVGPDSEHLLEAEGAPEDAWWEPTSATPPQPTRPAP